MLRLPASPPLFPYTTLFRSIRWKLGFDVSVTSCGRAVPSTCTAAGDSRFIASVQSNVSVMNCAAYSPPSMFWRSEEHTSELQSHSELVCRLLLEKRNKRRLL